MPDEIKNRVAQSRLKTIDLEDYYPLGNRVKLDISQFLFEGIILKEKDFRAQVTSYNWEQYRNCFVALTNTSGAIIPGWAFMLLTLQLNLFAKLVLLGSLKELETHLFASIISQLDLSEYKNKPVIIKGCSNKPIPNSAYVLLIQKLQPFAKSIMYGEACSSVPLYKRK